MQRAEPTQEKDQQEVDLDLAISMTLMPVTGNGDNQCVIIMVVYNCITMVVISCDQDMSILEWQAHDDGFTNQRF